jgi:hypothetical protein
MWLTSDQASDLPMPADCRLIADLTVNLSLSESIHAWSIWRGYFFAVIDQCSLGDTVILVLFLCTVAGSPLPDVGELAASIRRFSKSFSGGWFAGAREGIFKSMRRSSIFRDRRWQSVLMVGGAAFSRSQCMAYSILLVPLLHIV